MTPSSESLRLADQAAKAELASQQESSTTLREQYLAVADQLEVDGIECSKIAKTARHLIEDRMNAKNDGPRKVINTYFQKIMSEAGYTDPEYDHKSSDAQLAERQNSSATNNAELIERLKLTKELCSLEIAKLRTYEDIRTSGLVAGKDLDEFLKQWDAILQNCSQAFDEKTKVPANAEQVLLDCLALEASMTLAGKRLMQTRVQHMDDLNRFLTRKQAAKFQRGDAASRLAILQPHDRDHAIFMGYLGQQCPECDSWRVRVDENDRHAAKCVECGDKSDIRTVAKCPYCYTPLYDDVIAEIAMTGNLCTNVNCRREIVFPRSMGVKLRVPSRKKGRK